MTFTPEQITLLEQKLEPKHIKKIQGNDYIEGWHAIAEANRIFGYDGWSYQIVRLDEMSQHTNANGTMIVGYICQVRVTVGNVTREDVGYGTGMSKTDISSCHEGASKEAVTDGIKRALKSFGNQFGLALYDKLKTNVGVNEAPRRSKIDSRDDYSRLEKDIRDEPTISGLTDLWRRNKETLDTMHQDYVDELIREAGDRKTELNKQLAA